MNVSPLTPRLPEVPPNSSGQSKDPSNTRIFYGTDIQVASTSKSSSNSFLESVISGFSSVRARITAWAWPRTTQLRQSCEDYHEGILGDDVEKVVSSYANILKHVQLSNPSVTPLIHHNEVRKHLGITEEASFYDQINAQIARNAFEFSDLINNYRLEQNLATKTQMFNDIKELYKKRVKPNNEHDLIKNYRLEQDLATKTQMFNKIKELYKKRVKPNNEPAQQQNLDATSSNLTKPDDYLKTRLESLNSQYREPIGKKQKKILNDILYKSDEVTITDSK